MPEETLYRLRPVVERGGDAGHVIVKDAMAGRRWKLPRDLYGALLMCNDAATVRGHAARLQSRLAFPEQMRQDLGAMLQGCVDSGLLVKDSEVLAGVARADEKPVPPISRLVIPTRGDRAGLAAVLESHLLANARFGHRLETIIISDSEALPIDVEDVLKRWNGSVSVITRSERRSLADRVAGLTGIERGVVRTALLSDEELGGSPGATRNTALLLTAGELILSVDDDVPCRGICTGPPGERLSLFPTSAADTYCVEPVADPSELPESRGIDLIDAHERILGRSLPACLDLFGGNADVGSSEALSFAAGQHSGSAVKLTQTGLIGDCARDTPWFLVHARPELQREWSRDAARCSRILGSRWMTQSVERHTVLLGGNFMSFCFGMDNRGPVAPFPSFARGEDSVFAAVAGVSTGALIGVLPLAVRHSPAQSRGYAQPGLAGCVAGSPIAWLVHGLWRLLPAGEQPAPARISMLGRMLENVALNKCDLIQWLGEARRDLLAQRIEYIDRLICTAAPGLWRRELEAARDCGQHALESRSFDESWSGDGSAFRRTLLDYARLLQGWVAMHEAARSMANGSEAA